MAASRTPLQRLNFTLDSEDTCSVQTKKWFLWTVTAAQAAENHGDEWNLLDIYDVGYTHQFQPEATHKIH